MFLLVDCNNFFASIEQVFDPKLRDRPLVVLSSGDGCVIARSKEAKALGIPMSAPIFKYRDLFLRHNVQTRSSNFPLYGDMSRRVMEVLSSYELDMEVYSVDEAFIYIEHDKEVQPIAEKIRARIFQWTGLYVSIGIASTKTLAKMATQFAKTKSSGVCLLNDCDIENHLRKFDIGDIWGIGQKLKEKLNSYGIRFALDLTKRSDTWIRKQISVVGLRTVYELKGTSCLKLDEISPQKSILRSRSFEVEIGTQSRLEEKIASFAETIGRRLRKHNLACESICVFASSNRFSKTSRYVSDLVHLHLPEATSYSPYLIAKAKHGLGKIFQKGVLYKRAGIMVYGLSNTSTKQKDLFGKNDLSEKEKNNLMDTYDRINSHYGGKSLYFAAEGIYEKYNERTSNRSGNYTTSWNELLQISLLK